MAVRILVHPEARAWVPTRVDQEKILAYFGPKIDSGTVRILPRSLANQVLGRELAPYSFRAFTRDGVSNVFVDRTETPQSVAFLIAHELTHQAVDGSPTLEAAFADARMPRDTPWSDRFHHVDAEERFCDGVAGKLLGTWFDREWWRARTQRAGGRTEAYGGFRLYSRRSGSSPFRLQRRS
jgi:hypothetical protein